MLKLPENVGDLIRTRLDSNNYETHPLMLVEKYIKPHHRVLEGGAGLGYITRRLCSLAQLVVSVEANDELYKCAEENAPEAIVIKRVLSGKPLTSHEESAHTGDAFGVGEVSKAIPIEANSLIQGFRLNALCLDIEGSESDVLQTVTLDPLELIIVEWHPDLTGSIPLAKAHKRLLDAGFRQEEKISDGALIHAAYLRD